LGGINLIFSEKRFINFCKARMLSSDGRCKSFDASCTITEGGSEIIGSGYGRGEGGGFVILKNFQQLLIIMIIFMV